MAEHPFIIGEKYFLRTVTFHYTGRLTKVFDKELVFEDVAWIADDGNFSQSFTKDYEEVDPFPDGEVIVGRGALLDMAIIKKDLPRTRK
jgi:hypothetical protein